MGCLNTCNSGCQSDPATHSRTGRCLAEQNQRAASATAFHSHNQTITPQLTMQTEQKQGPNQTRAQMRQKTGPQLSCISVHHYATIIYGSCLNKYAITVTNVQLYFKT